MPLNILYEDNHIIVVEKKENILSQSDITNDIDMLTIIKNYLKEKYHKKGNVYLGLVHRLDRPTSGIMVFAKTSKAAARLNKEIKDNEFTKKYLLIIKGSLIAKDGTLENYIKKVDTNSIITSKEDGKLATLKYKVLKEKDNLSLVEVELLTGRHHQIRVQFNNINHPLLGDLRYGNIKADRLYLHAYYLSFNHPTTKERLEFTLYPKNGLWDTFKEVYNE